MKIAQIILALIVISILAINLIPLHMVKGFAESQSVLGKYVFDEAALSAIKSRTFILAALLILFALFLPWLRRWTTGLYQPKLNGLACLNTIPFYLVFSIGVLLRLIYLNEPMRVDESFTYINYISKNFFVAISRYNSTNNHLLNTLLSNLSCLIFGPYEWAIRFPNFIFGILIMPLTQILTNELKSKSMIPLILVATSSPLIHYSVSARTYCIIAALFLLMLIVRCRLKGANNLLYWIILSVTSALAMYANAIGITAVLFIYSLISIDYFLSFKSFKDIFFSAVSTVFLTLFLYSPVILVSGNLFPNRIVDFTNSYSVLGLITNEWFTGLPRIIPIIFIISFAISLFSNLRIAIAFFAAYIPMLFLHTGFPPERTWLFFLPPFIVMATMKWKI